MNEEPGEEIPKLRLGRVSNTGASVPAEYGVPPP